MEKEELLELVAVLTLKNMALEEDLKAIEESYHKVVKKLHDERIEKEYTIADTGENLVGEEAIKYEAASRQAELEEAREQDDLFKDWTPPSYEDVVDPEFDRGYDMAYDRAIGDIMNYLEDSKKYILIGNLRNYLQGLRDSK